MNDEQSMIDRAVAELRGGGVVAIPTETVYGLAADATRDDAVARVFALKGRPPTNPLIVHVDSIERAREFTTRWDDRATRLAERYWPGPLTLVLPAGERVSRRVTAGLNTVALRVPAHPLTLRLLRAFAGGLAAPSANRSNRISPTAASHVREEFADHPSLLILDGGACAVGLESTVLDLSGDRPRVLRPGGITAEMLESIVGPVDRVESMVVDQSRPASSPGLHARHYAPSTPAYRFEPHQRPLVDLDNAAIVEPTLDPQTYARQLYARLRLLDSQGLDAIYIEMPPDTPAWHAARDRIRRATRPIEDRPT